MNHHFRDWLRFYCGLDHTAVGWGAAIDLAHTEPVAAFDAFYDYLAKYRELRPRVVASVDTPSDSVPTGSRRTYSGSFIARPDRIDRIELMRYFPLPIHHLRLWYGTQLDNHKFLSTPDGAFEMGIDDAVTCASDELGIDSNRWHHYLNDG